MIQMYGFSTKRQSESSEKYYFGCVEYFYSAVTQINFALHSVCSYLWLRLRYSASAKSK